MGGFVVQDIVTVVVRFFFQAEDGIRDLTVTGVQTCALPIWPSFILVACLLHSPRKDEPCGTCDSRSCLSSCLLPWAATTSRVPSWPWRRHREIGRASCRERV